jgi:hypothetical protein
MVMSGVNSSDLSTVSDAEVLKFIQKRFQDRPSARLLCIFLVCYSVPDKDFQQLLAYIDEESKEVVQKVKNLAGNSNRFGILKRVAPVMSERDKVDYKRKSA